MTGHGPIALAPLSVIYGAITRGRLLAYRRGLLPVSQLKATVISVGNITTGGTGKTPLVEFIARALAHQGQNVCVLTRGYGRDQPKHRVVVSDGQSILASESEAGDEAHLLAEELLGLAAVISDADRFAAGTWAIENLGSEVFVLDDGFQHLRLARNVNIVTIDATNPWGNGRLLPWGRLREPKQGLARADCVVITRADQVADLSDLRTALQMLAPDKPVFNSRMTIRGVKPLTAESLPNPTLVDDQNIETHKPVAAFCGVGNPSSFFAQLKDAGYVPVSTTVFRDHHRYTRQDIEEIVRSARAAGARGLITTAKDAIKLRKLAIEIPCYVLEIEISIEDESSFLKFIDPSGKSKRS